MRDMFMMVCCWRSIPQILLEDLEYAHIMATARSSRSKGAQAFTQLAPPSLPEDGQLHDLHLVPQGPSMLLNRELLEGHCMHVTPARGGSGHRGGLGASITTAHPALICDYPRK